MQNKKKNKRLVVNTKNVSSFSIGSCNSKKFDPKENQQN